MSQIEGAPRTDPSVSLVPWRVRQALRPPVESGLLYLERRRGPSQDFGMPDGFRSIYLYHVRKTGGSSIGSSFFALGGEDPGDVERRIGTTFLRRAKSGPYVFAGKCRRTLESGRYFFGRSHYAAHELNLPKGTFTVTVIRDPLKRAISYFNYLVAGDDPNLVWPVPDDERRLADGGFHAFLDRVPKRDLLCQLAMFSSSFNVDEAVERVGRCSLVLRTEQLDDGLATLNDRLALHLEPRRDRVSAFRAELDAGELDRLRELLVPEYQMFEQLAPKAADGAVAAAGPSSGSAANAGEPEQPSDTGT